MPLRAVLLFICVVIFLGTTIARAEDCACPVVQCEPCQRKLVLGTQIKECSKSPAVVCQKVVCENVDNFFQCIAGAPPLYIPPQDPALRYTEPRFTPGPEKPQPIDFSKLAVTPNTVGTPVIAEPAKEEPQFEVPNLGKSRDLASLETSWDQAPAPWILVLERTSGEVWHGQKQLRKSNSFRSTAVLVAKKKSQLIVRFARDSVKMDMSQGAQIQLTVQDGVLLAQKISGEVQMTIEASHDLFVVDLGDWRFGKKTGSLKVSRVGTVTTVENILSTAFLRRETLISQADTIQEGEKLKFEDGADLYSSVNQFHDKSKLTNYVLQGEAPEADPAGAGTYRAPATDAFCGAPAGQYEQCAWKCFGAKADAKNCAGTQVSAKCVRFTCSADGQWKLPTIVSDGECATNKIHVGICH